MKPKTAAALERAVAGIADFAPEAAAWHLDVEGGQIARFVSSADGGPLSPQDPIPDWATAPYEGVVQTRDAEWFGASTPDAEGDRIAVVMAPLTPMLRVSAREEDLSLRESGRSIWATGTRIRPPRRSSPTPRATVSPSAGWTALLLEAAPWNRELGGGRIVVSFGFAPIDLIQGTTSGLSGDRSRSTIPTSAAACSSCSPG